MTAPTIARLGDPTRNHPSRDSSSHTSVRYGEQPSWLVPAEGFERRLEVLPLSRSDRANSGADSTRPCPKIRYRRRELPCRFAAEALAIPAPDSPHPVSTRLCLPVGCSRSGIHSVPPRRAAPYRWGPPAIQKADQITAVGTAGTAPG